MSRAARISNYTKPPRARAALVSGVGTKSDSPYDLPALQPPPSASEEALDQVLIPQKASLGSPKSAAHRARAKEEGQTRGHSPSRGRPAGSRRAGRAGLPRWRRREAGAEFESRSRKRLGLPATPAHGWPPRGPSLLPLRAPDFGGPQNARGSPALGRKLRTKGAQAAAGGRED